jgi:hypothetical protein
MSEAKRPIPRVFKWLLIGLTGAIFVGANAHFVYMAIATQPACIEHIKEKASNPTNSGPPLQLAECTRRIRCRRTTLPADIGARYRGYRRRWIPSGSGICPSVLLSVGLAKAGRT